MHTTSTPCHVCADHDTDLCPGSIPECPAFLDSLDLDATLSLFRFPVSTRLVGECPECEGNGYVLTSWHTLYGWAEYDTCPTCAGQHRDFERQYAHDDMRAVGITL